MQRLETDRHILRPLIEGMAHHLSVHAFAEGTMPGWAYVDDRDRPRSAIAFNSEGWYLVGEANNPPFVRWLRGFLNDEVIPGERAVGEGTIPLHFHPNDWQPLGTQLLPTAPFIIDYQQYLRFDRLAVDWRTVLPAGCSLHEIDAAVLDQPECPPAARMVRWAEGAFGSREGYLREKLGRCIEQDGEITCWCMPDCAVGDRCEIGIHTIAEKRRRGLATAAVAATVGGCLARGYKSIGWHCWSGNEASAGLARKVGFVKVLDHYAFCVRLT